MRGSFSALSEGPNRAAGRGPSWPLRWALGWAICWAIAGAAGAAHAKPVPQVELVIVGPSDAIYSLYGHAAIRVVDDQQDDPGDARVFNFGITNFKRPNYVRDFVGGRVEFWGKIERWATVLDRWRRTDRTVVRYPVLLPEVALRGLVARMERDTTPEHRDFVYDTFRENCSTRLRDYLDTYSRGAVHAAIASAPAGRAFRQDVRQAYSKHTSLLLGTEIVPGVELDRARTLWEMTYRPEVLGEALKMVQFDGHALLGPGIVEHTRSGADPLDGSPQHGQIIILIVALLFGVLGWFVAGRGPRLRGGVLATVALLASGLGMLLIWVATMSDWPEMQRNPLVFAVVPLDLLLLWPAGRLIVQHESGPAAIARTYLKARLVVALLLVALTPLLDVLAGPLPARVLAVSWVWVALRCLDAEGRAGR